MVGRATPTCSSTATSRGRGPVAGIAVVGVARAAYETALDWAHTYTSGGPRPIIHYQYPGYVLGDVAAEIEMARYFCWKAAHYLDQHDYHCELIGAMSRSSAPR